MAGDQISVQGCGCIALPDELAAGLGMLPGAVLSIVPDLGTQSLTLRVATSAPANLPSERPACPLEP